MKKRFLLIFFLLSSRLIGQNYFQQRVDYQIDVVLNINKKQIKAYEKIIYKNNSPDTLEYIYFHLWANGYCCKRTAYAKQSANSSNPKFYFRNKEYRGNIDSLDFHVDGKQVKIKYDKHNPDICKLILNAPLEPGKSITITTPFIVNIPYLTSRLGYTEKSFEITQWYPKPAVYDKYGWHVFPYLNQGEFYSEFGSYDVKITLPSDYVVAATGRLLTETEKKWQQSLSNTNSRGCDIPYPGSKSVKTVHFYQDSIHDFAWFASDQYYVNQDTINLKSHTVKVKAYYFGTNTEWLTATDYIKEALRFYSNKVGEYPYDVCTAVEGYMSAGGGMEYPTITVVSSSDIEPVIIHEVGHNWFYGILAFNEREYPFLDEGINSYYDHRWAEENNKVSLYSQLSLFFNSDIDSLQNVWIEYLIYQLGTEFIYPQPMDIHSTKYNSINYFLDVYQKSALAFRYLNHYLGKKEFDRIMHKFFEQWKFKHPYPDDLAQIFKDNATKNVQWFFDSLITSNIQIDYKINYRNKQIILKNKSKINPPVPIVAIKNDSIIFKKWIQTDKKKKIRFEKDFDKIVIDPFYETLEFYRYNNIAHKSLFRRHSDGYKIKFLSINFVNYYKRSISIFPVVYKDMINSWKAGVFITNFQIPRKNFTYYFLPMYDIEKKKFFGSFSFSIKKRGYDGFPTRKFNLSIDRYTYYDSDTSGYLPLPFRRFNINYSFILHKPDGSDKFYKVINTNFTLISPTRLPIFGIKYIMAKKSFFRPTMFRISADFMNDSYVFWTDFSYTLHYDNIRRGLTIRLFTGSNVSPTGITYGNDYKLQYVFLNPLISPQNMYNKGFLAHQFVAEEGALASLYPYKRYPVVFALNLKSSIPKVPIIKIFGNISYFANLQNGQWFNILNLQKPLWESGIMLSIIPNILEIYFPLYSCKALSDYNNSLNNKILSHYRINLNLEMLNYIK